MSSITLFFNTYFGSYGPTFLKIFKLISIYLCYIIFHYLASHLYIDFCVPSTIIGFIQSPFVAVLPHCQALRWIIYKGGNNLSIMWKLLGGWILLKVGNYLTEAEKEVENEDTKVEKEVEEEK